MVKKNRFGFYELKEKPSPNELTEYYKEKYYQESKSTYEKKYSEKEILHIQNMIEQKYFILKDLFSKKKEIKQSMLDIGAGEGWVLDYYKKKGWDCTGLDFSDFGLKAVQK